VEDAKTVAEEAANERVDTVVFVLASVRAVRACVRAVRAGRACVPCVRACVCVCVCARARARAWALESRPRLCGVAYVTSHQIPSRFRA